MTVPVGAVGEKKIDCNLIPGQSISSAQEHIKGVEEKTSPEQSILILYD